MLVTIKYFGLIIEITEIEQELVESNDIHTLEQLNSFILEKYPKLKNVTYNIAQNQNIVSLQNKLTEGDIIAFLPPFAGG